MNSAVLYELVSFFGVLSLLSFGGGNTVIPEIQRHAVLVMHWLSEADFVAVYAIAQSAPGPSSLLVTLIGWKAAAWPGAVVATLAMYTPSSIVVFFVGRRWQRFRGTGWHIRLEGGLMPVTIGLIIASGWIVAQGAERGYISWLLTGCTAILVARTKLNPLLIVLTAGIIGVLAWP